MTLQPLPSEFPYKWGKFYFIFYQCTRPLTYAEVAAKTALALYEASHVYSCKAVSFRLGPPLRGTLQSPGLQGQVLQAEDRRPVRVTVNCLKPNLSLNLAQAIYIFWHLDEMGPCKKPAIPFRFCDRLNDAFMWKMWTLSPRYSLIISGFRTAALLYKV